MPRYCATTPTINDGTVSACLAIEKMLSPMDIDGGKMAAPSIYSFDSGYKSESLWEEEGALQGQTVRTYPVLCFSCLAHGS